MMILEYKLKKNTKGGITAMSIVDDPAVMIDFIKLNKEVPDLQLSTNDEQHIVTGPALIPNLKIFRSAESLHMEEDGYIYFSVETVKEMAELFMINERMNNITLDHSIENSDLKLIESWIVLDETKDKALALGFDVPKGTWMVSYKVDNDKLWTNIKENKYNGFSIEAFDFERTIVEMNKQEADMTNEEIKSLLSNTLLDVLTKIKI